MTHRNCFIFQCKKEKFDLADARNATPGTTDTWVASRYRTAMSAGDIVYLWMSGDKTWKGIYGWGVLATGASIDDDGGYAVQVRNHTKLSRYITYDRIAGAKALRNLMILRVAIGTNFLINAHEGLAIAGLIEPAGESPLDLLAEAP